MRTALVAGMVMAWVAPAMAEPCKVTIVRAPEEVRTAVERWLATERCGVPLAVRIVESEGELYIFAIDDKGGVRERTVPDAQSAGLLIASWTADDGLSNPTSVAAPVPAPSFDASPTPTFVSPTSTEGYSIVSERFVARPRHPLELSDQEDHWITLAAGSTMTSGFAGRAEIEVLRHQSFAVSIVTGIAQNRDAISSDTQMSSFKPSYTDLTAMIAAQHTWRWPSWHVRAGVAAGVVASSLSLDWTNVYGNSVRETASQVSLVTEVSAQLGYALTDHWEAEVGPALTSSNQGWYMQNQMETLLRRPWGVAAYFGLRRAL